MVLILQSYRKVKSWVIIRFKRFSHRIFRNCFSYTIPRSVFGRENSPDARIQSNSDLKLTKRDLVTSVFSRLRRLCLKKSWWIQKSFLLRISSHQLYTMVDFLRWHWKTNLNPRNSEYRDEHRFPALVNRKQRGIRSHLSNMFRLWLEKYPHQQRRNKIDLQVLYK